MDISPTTFKETAELASMLREMPGAVRLLFKNGIPSEFLAYRVDAELTLLDCRQVGAVLRFGSCGPLGALCIDTASGEVVELLDTRHERFLFVNSSLGQFAETIKTVAGRFPYYEVAASPAQMHSVAKELLGLVAAIDPDAALPDRYWSILTDDAAVGDLATESLDEEW